MQKVVSIERLYAPAGDIFALHLACGHEKRVTPLDDPRDYARAGKQQRASCKVCAGVRLTAKECPDCSLVKPVSAFYRARGKRDGYQKRCKECQVLYIKTLNDGRPYTATAAKVHRERNPLKYQARMLLNNAVSRGQIVKPKQCEECGIAADLHGHHDDYREALNVRWLCQPCHADWHRLYGNALP
jgi:hypothetical protein